MRIDVARTEEALERDGVLLVAETESDRVAKGLAEAYFGRTRHWVGVVARVGWELVFELRPDGG